MGERRDRPGAQAAHALRWLGAPGTLVSLAVLAVNDHVLKQVWPGVVTGKLSDIARRRCSLWVWRGAVRLLLPPGAGFPSPRRRRPASRSPTPCGPPSAGPPHPHPTPRRAAGTPARRHAQPLGAQAGAGASPLAAGSLALPFAVVATAATSPCYEPQGLTSVGVVRGDFTGPPAAEEERIVIPSGGSMPPLHRHRGDPSCRAPGGLRADHRSAPSYRGRPHPERGVTRGGIWFGRRRAPWTRRLSESGPPRSRPGEDAPHSRAGQPLRAARPGAGRTDPHQTPSVHDTPSQGSQPTPPGPQESGLPCAVETLVTVTPDPRNGPPQTREVCARP